MANKKKTAKRAPSEHSLLSPNTPVLIRTAVYHWTGRVNRIIDVMGVAFVELSEAAWQADTGPYSQALRDGTEKTSQAEIEPVPDDEVALVQLASIGDIALHPEPLPRKQK